MLKYSPILFSLMLSCGSLVEKHKVGDVLLIKVDSINYSTAIILTSVLNGNSIEYGLCFTNYLDSAPPILKDFKNSEISGRKIQTYNDPGYEIAVDLIYLADTSMENNRDKISTLQNVDINIGKGTIGSEAFAKDFSQFVFLYKRGFEARLLPPDHYTEIYKLEKFRPEEYLPIKSILK